MDDDRLLTEAQAAKVRVVGLTKIFGRSPVAALDFLRRGDDKGEILRRTGDVVALDDVTFAVEEGEIFILMGLSGSGKSTLARCLNLLVRPTAGRVYIDGLDITSLPDAQLREIRRRKMSMVFQHFGLFPHKSVIENVAYGLKIQGLDKATRNARARAVLELVGLDAWAEKHPRNLSGGMQQRVGLARALAPEPDILLMDEPFSALDPLIRRDMQNELLELQSRLRKTIVFITHDMAEALRLGDRVAIMRDGRIVQTGTPSELVSTPADAYVANFVRGVDRGQFLRVEAVMSPASRVRASIAASSKPEVQPGELLFAVDESERPVGVIGPGAAGSSASRVAERMSTAFARVRTGTSLEEAYSACSAGLPVAVVDQGGRLVGALQPTGVLAALVKDQDQPGGNTSA